MDYIYKIICVSVYALAFPLSAYAETVSMKQAKSMAQNFFNEARHQVTPPVSYVYNGKDLTTHRLFTPFYVFNSPSGGFVIISAENKAFPILGYSLDYGFEKSKMTPMVKSILSDFSRDIEMIRYDSRIPADAIDQWNGYPNVVFDIIDNSDNSDFYTASYDDKGLEWKVRRFATEFDFEVEDPVAYALAPAAVENISLPEAPIVTSNIAGHFALSLPVDIVRVIVYNAAGLPVLHKKYKNTNTAHIDISAEPNGFYFALLIDSDGISHSAKLYR